MILVRPNWYMSIFKAGLEAIDWSLLKHLFSTGWGGEVHSTTHLRVVEDNLSHIIPTRVLITHIIS